MAQPNLLFVFADQLRARELDDPTHPLITPAYDRLRREGTRCVNTVANCPVCTPSRAILLTGQYPWSNRVLVNDLPLPTDSVTIGSRMKQAGYRTGYVGKWHLDGVPRSGFTPPGARRHGFDYWAVYNCTHNYYGSAYYRDDPEPIPIRGYEPVRQTDLAIEFLEQEGEAPFCLFVSWGPPHDPYHLVPPWFEGLYDPARLDLPGNFRPPDRSLVAAGHGEHAVGAHLDQRQSVARYYAACSALDHELMRLLEALDRTGQAANTIVVYTSDHGDMLWSHGRVNKQQPWDESVRIPFVIRWPEAIEAGVDRQGCLGIVDFAPTLLSLCGLQPAAGMEGTDQSGMLLGGSPGQASSFIFDILAVDQGLAQSVPSWRGVRTQRHTYCRLADGTPWLLFDNQADPDQLTNLLDAPGHELLCASLEAELDCHQTVAGDDGTAGDELLRRYDLVELWNARERELRGPHARLLEPA